MRRLPLLALVAIPAVLALWLIPPALDWGRLRAPVAALIAARIGQPVQIDGSLRLRLFPAPVLDAANVQVADSGDGISGHIAEVRLRLDPIALIGGQVVAAEIRLHGPILRAPALPDMALFDRLATLRRPALGSSVVLVDAGRFALGHRAATAIEAELHATRGTLSATGTLRLGGLPWRFAASLDPPGPAGARFALGLTGQAAMRATEIDLTGRIDASGRHGPGGRGPGLTAQLAAHGEALGVLLPAPPLPWRAEGRLTATAAAIEAPALDIVLDGAPGQATARLTRAQLTSSVTLDRLDLDRWIPALPRLLGGGLPVCLALRLRAATLAGNTLTDIDASLDPDGRVALRHAILPGAASLALQGVLAPGLSGFAGQASLSAPDLAATLRWLRPLAPEVIEGLPGPLRPDAPASAAPVALDLAGQLRVAPHSFAASNLSGALDGAPLRGGLGIALGKRPGVGLDLRVDRIDLDPWLDPTPLLPARLATAFARFDGGLHLVARTATWHGVPIAALTADLNTDRGGIALAGLSADLLGGHLAVAGRAGTDGSLHAARLSLSLPRGTALLERLPQPWQIAAPLWDGPTAFELTADGPAGALATQLRADLGDLRLEGDGTVAARKAGLAGSTATITLRHPSAALLLDRLGAPGARAWLDEGSLAVATHAHATADGAVFDGLDLTAGALRGQGRLALSWRTARPVLSGRLSLDVLPLPPLSLWTALVVPPDLTGCCDASVHLEAARVLAGMSPVAADAAADLSADAGGLAISLTAARVAGGLVGGEVALRTQAAGPAAPAATSAGGAGPPAGSEPPVLTLKLHGTGLRLPHAAPPAPQAAVSLQGVAGFEATLRAIGHGAAAWRATLSGQASAHVQGGTLVGLDLAAAGRALAEPAGAPGLQAALQGGQTALPDGSASVSLADGRAVLQSAVLRAEAGSIAVSGAVDLDAGTLELALQLDPAIAGAPPMVVRLRGPFGSPERTMDLDAALAWLAGR